MTPALPDTTGEVKFSDSWASVLLDLVRGGAAVLVLLSHWKLIFFVDYPKIPGRRWPFAVPYVLYDAGHQAVMIFFVPALLLFAALLVGEGTGSPKDLRVDGMAMGALAVVLAFAYLVAKGTEFNTDRLRRGLAQALGVGQRPRTVVLR